MPSLQVSSAPEPVASQEPSCQGLWGPEPPLSQRPRCSGLVFVLFQYDSLIGAKLEITGTCPARETGINHYPQVTVENKEGFVFRNQENM